jgi:hypothetical protein
MVLTKSVTVNAAIVTLRSSTGRAEKNLIETCRPECIESNARSTKTLAIDSQRHFRQALESPSFMIWRFFCRCMVKSHGKTAMFGGTEAPEFAALVKKTESRRRRPARGPFPPPRCGPKAR